MSPHRFMSVLIVGLACVAMAASPRAAFAETPAQYLIPVQMDIVKFFDNGNIYAVENRPTRTTVFTLPVPIRAGEKAYRKHES